MMLCGAPVTIEEATACSLVCCRMGARGASVLLSRWVKDAVSRPMRTMWALVVISLGTLFCCSASSGGMLWSVMSGMILLIQGVTTCTPQAALCAAVQGELAPAGLPACRSGQALGVCKGCLQGMLAPIAFESPEGRSAES